MTRHVVLATALCAIAAVASAQPVAPSKPPAKVQVCAACHGADGNSKDPQYPILAGQTARYLFLQLRDFKAGRRKDPQMSPMAADLTPEEMLDLANWFSAQKPLPTGFKADAAKVEAGRKKADELLCTMCHLGGFVGQNEIPRVAGQHHDYVLEQLRAFKTGRRKNDAGSMTAYTSNLSDQDIDNLANYIANIHGSLPKTPVRSERTQ